LGRVAGQSVGAAGETVHAISIIQPGH
jgi:hypothetical protein